MQENIAFLDNLDNSVFLKKIKFHLSNNLTGGMIASLSNMLTIDYIERLKEKPEKEKYVMECVNRLKKYLEKRVFTEENFSGVMSLFIVAIADTKKADNDLVNSKEQQQDAAISAIIASNFSDLDFEQQKNAKKMLKSLISSMGYKKLLNFIASDPKLFNLIIVKSFLEKEKQKEVVESITINLNKIITNTKSLQKKRSNIKSFIGKIAMAAGLVAGITALTFSGGTIIPAIIIPTITISTKLSAISGEKISNFIAQKNSFVKRKQSIIGKLGRLIEQATSNKNMSEIAEQKQDLNLQKKSANIKSQVTKIANKKQQHKKNNIAR